MILGRLDDVRINGSMTHRLPHNLNVSFGAIDGEALLMCMSDVAVSSGSACTSATIEPSYVLKALGVSDELAHASIRFGLGRFNTPEEVHYAARRVVEVVQRLRALDASLEEPAPCTIRLKSRNPANAAKETIRDIDFARPELKIGAAASNVVGSTCKRL